MGLAAAWNSFWNNVFQPSAIEELNGSMFYIIKGVDSNVELDFRLLYKIYMAVPHLRAVIDEKSKLFSNARFVVKKLDTEDEILYNHSLQVRLNNPNVFQSLREFLFMVMAYKCISGDSYIFKNYSVGNALRNLRALTPIDYESVTVNLKRNALAFEAAKKEDYIDSIVFSIQGTQRKFTDLSELIHFHDSGIKFSEGISKIQTLKTPITNIVEALEARQTMIRRKGGIGALTGNQKDGGSQVPMSPKEKKEVQDKLNDYGLGKGKDPIIVTNVPMKWQSFVFPTKELMLFEEIEDDFHMICDQYGMKRELFEGQSNYSNKEHAERGTYQDTIIPEWQDFANKLNEELQTRREGVEICVDYSHIAILQDDEHKKVSTEKTKSDMFINELNNNLITREEYRDQMGYEGNPPPEKEEPSNNETEQETQENEA